MKAPDNETCTVLKTDGSEATVIMNKSSSCNECGKAQAGICGKNGAGMVMQVRNFAGARAGDTVELGLDMKTHLKGYFLVFFLPVIALFIGAYAGHVASTEFGVVNLDVLIGLTGLTLSLLYSVGRLQMIDRETKLHITKVLGQKPEYEVCSCPEEADYLNAYDRGNS